NDVLMFRFVSRLQDVGFDWGRALLGLLLAFVLMGCASISEHDHAYLGSPHFPATNPATVTILQSDPTRAKDRLGEVRLSSEGEPSPADIETKLREGAARLGADAIYVAYDGVHVFPVVYGGWYGPAGVSEYMRREVVGVAIKYK